MTRALPALWLCADLGHPAADEIPARAAAVLARADALLWLRSPAEMPAGVVLRAALALRAAAPGAWMLVGDRLDVARVSGADGVHLAERSVDPADARSFGVRTISRAAHDRDAIERHASRVDALVLSPFGAVPGKGAPLGPEGFAALRELAGGCFVVALGGISDVDMARAARAAGADAVAVRRALFAADPGRACEALAQVMRSG